MLAYILFYHQRALKNVNTEEQKPFISGEFEVSAVKRCKIAEIAFSKDEKKPTNVVPRESWFP